MGELEPYFDNKRGIVDWTRMSNDNVPLYTIQKFRFCYPDTDVVVLKNELDDIHIQQNRWVQIKGPSGSGKSTLIKLFLKTIETETPESFVFMGHSDYEFLSIREFVSTNSVGNGLFYETVEYNVYYSINHRDDALVSEYFDKFNIGVFDEHREKNINMMSSGQQQKIKVIRIILLILQRLHDPDGRHKQIFFLDEPTANMDPKSESVVLTELKMLREKYKLSFVFVSHSVAAASYADCYLGIDDTGQLYTEERPTEDAITLELEDMVTNKEDVAKIGSLLL
jgi:ABC-type lipoprotein export system ATPase subunit